MSAWGGGKSFADVVKNLAADDTPWVGGPTGDATTSGLSISSIHFNGLSFGAQKVINDVKSGERALMSAHDGERFGNYEGYLPDGSYTRYTVGSQRGSERLVLETNKGIWYWTNGHYDYKTRGNGQVDQSKAVFKQVIGI
jgi:guanyl-specific ribonuclease Sa